MITARPQKDLISAKTYFRQHLMKGDYYSEQRTVQGQWFGKGAARLGLVPGQPVSETAFLRLCDNQHPGSGEPLTVRHRKGDRRVFYDFVVSAPKSVSILALTAGDARIIQAHEEASRLVMERLEKLAATRVRKGGRREERTTAEVVGAIFRHEESRALDPQLHSHFLFFNATWDATENRWKAFEPAAMFKEITLHTEIYRNALAARLRSLGYAIESSDHGFEIAGVSRTILDRFSKRRRAILDEEARISERLGKHLSNNARAKVAHATRERKRSDLDASQLREYQLSQLTEAERQALLALTRQPQPAAAAVPSRGEAKAAIDYALEHLFERSSVVEADQILKVALVWSRHTLEIEELEAELRQRKELIEVDGALTTREGLKAEQKLIALINQGKDGCSPIRTDFRGDPDLSEEQTAALRMILHSTDEVVALRGLAGTGKTRLLKEVVRGIEERYGAVVLAPSAAAVEVLRKDGFTTTATVKRFLADPEFQERTRGKAIVVDEAGLLSIKDLLAMTEATRHLRARLILSGDTKQHHSVEAGDALRILEKHSALRTVEIKSIRRQVDREYCEVIEQLAKGHGSRALNRLLALGAVVVEPDSVRYEALAREFAESVKAGKSTLAVSPTWDEIDQVNGAIRGKLQEAGLLDKTDVEVESHQALKWTMAQKKDLRNYNRGMILKFHRATRDFGKNEWAEVTAIETSGLELRKQDGQKTRVTLKQAGCYDVASKETLTIATGERLLLQGNQKKNKLFNGQIVVVKEVQPDGTIRLVDGRNIGSDFRSFNLGYCVTSHASQGRTVDHVYLAMNSEAPQAVSQNQFYVSSSRGRERIRIFTDDLIKLREAVSKPGQRASATELIESFRIANELAEKRRNTLRSTQKQQSGYRHAAR